MTESGSPRAAVSDVIEVLHSLSNVITVRSHYSEGHPAITRADGATAASFNTFLARTPEIILALIEGEFVVNERPMPGLRRHLGPLADGMTRHEIECLVFQRGISASECGLIGRTLRLPTQDQPAILRAELQGGLKHVLLRFAALKRGDGAGRASREIEYIVPEVHELFVSVVRSIAQEKLVELASVRSIAARVLDACHARAFRIEQRAYAPGIVDEAAHATNVAFMCGAMAIDAEVGDDVANDLIGAALLHDIGLILLPERIRGVPSPLLDSRDLALFRSHPTTGAAALLASGCPPLWVAAALDHHRGVDGGGFPVSEDRTQPHELVRMISLASYLDRRRTRANGLGDEPEEALRRAVELEERYFGFGLVDRFMRALGAYPPGTTVELSDGSVGVVVQSNPHDPLRPQVRILFGEVEGRRVELKDLNALEDRHALSIVRAVDPPLAISAARLEEPISVVRATPAQAPTRKTTPPPRRRTVPPLPREEDDISSLPVLEPIHDGEDDISNLPVLEPLPEGDDDISNLPVLEPVPEGEDEDELDPANIPLAEPARSKLPPPVAVRESDPVQRNSLVAQLSDASHLRRVPKLRVSPDELVRVGLDHHAGFFLTFIDGMSTVEEVVDASGLPRAEAGRILNELIARGVISLD